MSTPIGNDPYADQMTQANDDYDYYTQQQKYDYDQIQTILNPTMKKKSADQQSVLSVLLLFVALLNYNQDCMGVNAASQEKMGVHIGRIGSMTNYFAMGNTLSTKTTPATANDYLQQMQDEYDDVKNDPDMDPSDKNEILGYISNITTAYQNEANKSPNTHTQIPVNGDPHSLKPEDLVNAQQNWYDQVNNPDGGAEDNEFQTVNSNYNTLSKKFTSQQATLGTQQQALGDTNTQIQATDKSNQDWIINFEKACIQGQNIH